MLGIPLQKDFDGAPIPYTNPSSANNEYINVEFWNADGVGKDNDDPANNTPGLYINNTYKSLRINSQNDNSFYYSVWCDGDHEFYDMTVCEENVNCIFVLQSLT